MHSLALQGRNGQARELLALALRNDPANQYANSNIRMIEDTLPRQADVGTDAVAAAQPATTPETDRTEPRHTPDTRWADRPWPEPITADTQTPGTETPITGTETADTGRGTDTPMASRTDSAAPLITGWSDSQWLAAEPTPPRTAPPADPSADEINTARAEPVSGPARALEPTREAAPELTQAPPREQQTHTPLPTRVPTLAQTTPTAPPLIRPQDDLVVKLEPRPATTAPVAPAAPRLPALAKAAPAPQRRTPPADSRTETSTARGNPLYGPARPDAATPCGGSPCG